MDQRTKQNFIDYGQQQRQYEKQEYDLPENDQQNQFDENQENSEDRSRKSSSSHSQSNSKSKKKHSHRKEEEDNAESDQKENSDQQNQETQSEKEDQRSDDTSRSKSKSNSDRSKSDREQSEVSSEHSKRSDSEERSEENENSSKSKSSRRKSSEKSNSDESNSHQDKDEENENENDNEDSQKQNNSESESENDNESKNKEEEEEEGEEKHSKDSESKSHESNEQEDVSPRFGDDDNNQLKGESEVEEKKDLDIQKQVYIDLEKRFLSSQQIQKIMKTIGSINQELKKLEENFMKDFPYLKQILLKQKKQSEMELQRLKNQFTQDVQNQIKEQNLEKQSQNPTKNDNYIGKTNLNNLIQDTNNINANRANSNNQVIGKKMEDETNIQNSKQILLQGKNNANSNNMNSNNNNANIGTNISQNKSLEKNNLGNINSLNQPDNRIIESDKAFLQQKLINDQQNKDISTKLYDQLQIQDQLQHNKNAFEESQLHYKELENTIQKQIADLNNQNNCPTQQKPPLQKRQFQSEQGKQELIQKSVQQLQQQQPTSTSDLQSQVQYPKKINSLSPPTNFSNYNFVDNNNNNRNNLNSINKLYNKNLNLQDSNNNQLFSSNINEVINNSNNDNINTDKNNYQINSSHIANRNNFNGINNSHFGSVGEQYQPEKLIQKSPTERAFNSMGKQDTSKQIQWNPLYHMKQPVNPGLSQNLTNKTAEFNQQFEQLPQETLLQKQQYQQVQQEPVEYQTQRQPKLQQQQQQVFQQQQLEGQQEELQLQLQRQQQQQMLKNSKEKLVEEVEQKFNFSFKPEYNTQFQNIGQTGGSYDQPTQSDKNYLQNQLQQLDDKFTRKK